MKTIKVKFVGFYSNFKYEYKKTLIYKILSKNYNVEITDDADYVICSVFGQPYEYCKYPQIRIMYCGENYIPDFNLIDYGIFNYPLAFQDRAFYMPFCIDEFGHFEALLTKDRNYSDDILNSKPCFANFVAGHESEYGIRGDFFKKLSEYKRIESCGTYLNNMPNGETVKWSDGTKRELQEKCKFTLCFESTKHEGFVTEKITDAFYSDTIPVYYGSSNAADIFNKEAYIDCSDFESFDAVMDYIIELDNDDEKYLEMLRKPIFNPKFSYSDTMRKLDEFVCHIFDQPIEKAYRRSRFYHPPIFNNYLLKAIPKKRNKWIKTVRLYFHYLNNKIKKLKH